MVTPPVLDQTAAMLAKGYRYGSDRRGGTDLLAFRARVLGRGAVCAIGTEAVRKLYDPTLFERHGAVPRPIQKRSPVSTRCTPWTVPPIATARR
jgi:fatty-acid peroxygenase